MTHKHSIDPVQSADDESTSSNDSSAAPFKARHSSVSSTLTESSCASASTSATSWISDKPTLLHRESEPEPRPTAHLKLLLQNKSRKMQTVKRKRKSRPRSPTQIKRQRFSNELSNSVADRLKDDCRTGRMDPSCYRDSYIALVWQQQRDALADEWRAAGQPLPDQKTNGERDGKVEFKPVKRDRLPSKNVLRNVGVNSAFNTGQLRAMLKQLEVKCLRDSTRA
ncbi:hypothetical protein OIV83_001985 [Microbotryomycetes sp. JL201]|nr:hypothetical protein OIV83_001985 [Microbotryomycetes sp. JL201]